MQAKSSLEGDIHAEETTPWLHSGDETLCDDNDNETTHESLIHPCKGEMNIIQKAIPPTTRVRVSYLDRSQVLYQEALDLYRDKQLNGSLQLGDIQTMIQIEASYHDNQKQSRNDDLQRFILPIWIWVLIKIHTSYHVPISRWMDIPWFIPAAWIPSNSTFLMGICILSVYITIQCRGNSISLCLSSFAIALFLSKLTSTLVIHEIGFALARILFVNVVLIQPILKIQLQRLERLLLVVQYMVVFLLVYTTAQTDFPHLVTRLELDLLLWIDDYVTAG